MIDPRPTSPPRLVLWHRRHTRDRWQAVASAGTERELLDAAKDAGVRGGDWYTAPAGTDPNAKPAR